MTTKRHDEIPVQGFGFYVLPGSTRTLGRGIRAKTYVAAPMGSPSYNRDGEHVAVTSSWDGRPVDGDSLHAGEPSYTPEMDDRASDDLALSITCPGRTRIPCMIDRKTEKED